MATHHHLILTHYPRNDTDKNPIEAQYKGIVFNAAIANTDTAKATEGTVVQLLISI